MYTLVHDIEGADLLTRGVVPLVHWEELIEEEEQPLNGQVPDPFGTDVANLPLNEDELRY